MTNEALPFVWDLRAYAQDPTHEIVPLQAGSEHQPFLNREGVLSLQQLSLQPDLDITDQMINGMETHAMSRRLILLCPSSRSFFENAGEAFVKAMKEDVAGVIEGGYGDCPCFVPIRVYSQGYLLCLRDVRQTATHGARELTIV